MGYLSIRGVDHYYEWISVAGRSHDLHQPHPGKPVMVFLHGWGGSARYWESTAASLSASFDCLLYDLRGFGRSRLPRPVPADVEALGYAIEGYGDDLVLLLDAMGLDQVDLNAHSTGASVAALFIQQYPNRVRRAILTCSGIFDYNPLTFSAFHRASEYVVRFRPRWLLRIPQIDRLFMSRFLKRPIPPRERQAFLNDYLQADFEAAMGTVYTAVSQHAAQVMPAAFRQITVPTLLFSGEYDQIIPVRLGTKAASLSSRIQHVVLPDTGHFPMLEDPAAYLEAVKAFLVASVER
ncbi:MAG: alpha/beta hydrolase [Synechococcales bacterium]|nr:alpha/beta hydrolase [Synechococcales bacterium]